MFKPVFTIVFIFFFASVFGYQNLPKTFQTKKLRHEISQSTGQDTVPTERRLILDEDGQLKSVKNETVTFRFPTDPVIKSFCYTPKPVIDSKLRDPSCPYVVPCDDPANRDNAFTNTFRYFTLKWHVMLDGGASSNIDQDRIDELMGELNADFAPFNVVFCTDPADFYEDAVNYDHDIETEEMSLKATYVTNATQIINIYVVGNMTAGGYARFPYDPIGGTSDNGGIVLNRVNCFLGTHTLAHEMGHVFGLYHTFSGVDEQSECTNCYEKVRNANGSSNTSGVPTPLGGPYVNEGDREGDWCSDTNPHDTNANECSTSSNANSFCDSNPWSNAPVNNHMSYSFCSTEFTQQQSRRMHCMIQSYLQSWETAGGAVCGAQPPSAEFAGSPTVWQAPSPVDFTDLSVPSQSITSWVWKFDVSMEGGVACAGCTGNQATFDGQTPPQVTYSNPGSYTVSLTVTNVNGSSTETKVDYIVVVESSDECDTVSNQWDTPTPTPINYTLSNGGYLAGVPNTEFQVNVTDTKGVYESFFSPSPGTTPVGSVRVGLGGLVDDNDDMTFRVSVYNDDGSDAPGVLLGSSQEISPTSLNIPGPNLFSEVFIPLETPLVPTTAKFHVGVEITPGGITDSLAVISSIDGEGEGDASNHILTTGINGFINIFASFGNLDIDFNIVPVLGEATPEVELFNFSQNLDCGETTVSFETELLYSTDANWKITFADGSVQNSATNPGSITRIYEEEGPAVIVIETINECGRANSQSFVIGYDLIEELNAEFSKVETGDICIGNDVNFVAEVVDYDYYLWDFGDGTFASTTTGTAMHSYSVPGEYYVSLTVGINSPISCSQSLTKTDFVFAVDCTVIPPTAVIELSSNTGCTPGSITFSDGTTAGDPVTSWLWNFGNGTISTLENPGSVSYPTADTYFVTLEVCNDGGCDETSETIVIETSTENTWVGPAIGLYNLSGINWSSGSIPEPCDKIVIPSGKTVTLLDGQSSIVKSVTVEDGGTLQVQPNAVLEVKE